MAEIVYSKAGEIKCKAKSLRYTGSFMGVSQLSVDIVSPVPVNLKVGDYIVFSYDGIRYTIVDLPQVQKQSSSGSTGNAFVYNDIVFKSPIGLLAHIDYLDTVLNENNVHYSTLPVFTFYGTVKDFADRLQANINRIYPSGWKVSVEGYDDTANANYDILHEYNEISISNIKCLDSLSIPYDTWGITYVFMVDDEGNNCIIFNHSLDSTSAKKYGKGNGLYSLTKRMSTEKAVITRLRAYGGTDNLPARYYNNLDGIDEGIYLPNLMIPRSKWKNQNDPITAYIDSTDIDVNDTAMSKYGIREESVFFDGSGDNKNIEPTIKGITAGMIRAAKAEAGDTENVPLESDYPDDERMDKILSCNVPDDNGLTREGEKLYSTTIDFNVIKGNDVSFSKYSETGKFSVSTDIETNLVIDTPAVYRINEKNNSIGNSYIASIRNTGTIESWDTFISSALMDVLVVDDNGNETLCASGLQLSFENNTHAEGEFNYIYSDIFFSGGLTDYVPAYFSVPYKGRLRFRIYINGTNGSDNMIMRMNAVPMTASMGALIQSKTFRVYIKQIGFNIEDYASAEEAKLVINSGACAGRSFNIKKNSVAEYLRYNSPGQIHTQIGWVFECFRSLDESIDQYFPNNIFPIEEGDEFVLTGLEMPDLYVRVAEQRLYDEAVELLRKRKDGLEVYELDIDNKVAYLDKVTIKEGMLIPLYDSDLKIGTKTDDTINYDYRIIDSVTIEIGEEPVPIIKAVLREEKEESVFKTLNRKLNTVASRTTQNVIRTQIVRVAEEVVRSNAPAYSPSAPEQGLSDFVTLSTAQTVTGDKTFASDVIPGGQKTDGTRGRLFLPSSLGTGAVDIFVDTETGIDGETPEPGAGGNAAWEVSTHRAHAVLNVSGERKEVALYGHRHTVSEISGLLGTDGLILSSLLPSVQSPVTSVAGLTGDITVSALRDALTDTDHLFVTSAEKSLWTSKWTWSEEAVKAVKVNNAVNADRLGGVPASDYVRTAALEDFCEGYLMWGALPQDNGSIQMTNGLGQSRSVSLHGHHHAVSDVDTGDGWDALLGSAAPSTLSGWGITDAYTKAQVSQILGNYLPLAGGTMTGDITMSGSSIRIPQSPSASSYDGILNADGQKAILAYYGDNTYTGLMTGTHYLRSGATSLIHRRNSTDYAILDAYNYASYTVTKTGGGASGTWGISISGNAASATKSATRKMPEGTDLNTLGAAVSTVGFANYYKSGGISVDNAPSDISDAAGLGFITWRIAAGFSAQLLAATSGGNAAGMIFRKLNSDDNTVLRDWAVVLDSLNVDDYALTLSNYTSILDGRYVNVSGDTMTGPLKYIVHGNRYLTLSEDGLQWDLSDVTGGHAHNWLRVTEPDGSQYAGMGVYGGTDGLNYLYIGGSYTAPWIALRPSGNVGIGVTSPSYRLHVGGNTYVNGIVYAASSFSLTNSNGRFVFDTASDATWLQGKADRRLGISGFNSTTLPRLDLVAKDTYATGDFRVGGKLYVPSSLGNEVFDIYVDTEVNEDGEVPVSGGGLDVDSLWTELSGSADGRVIAGSHIPLATASSNGGIRTGYSGTGKNYPVRLSSTGQAYVSVPWENTTYSLSSFGITATAAEINKLDGIGTLLHSGNYTSYTVTKTGGGASGTWGIGISGNAATADVSNYLFLNPNNGTHASQNDAVPANGRFAIYDVNAATTAGGNDGYIMAFRWPSGNFATQVFLDADSTGIMALRHRSDSNVWTEWYRILHSGNIGSYALTPSNYTSTLDSRYMQDGANLGGKAYLRYVGINGGKYNFLTNVANSTDPFMVYAPTTAGVSGQWLKSTGGVPVWANDGSGSGLDADLLDGQHGSYYAIITVIGNVDFNTVTRSGIYRLSYTTSNGASNGPSGNEWGNMLVLRGGGDTIAQLAFGYTSSARPKYRQGNPSNVGGSGSWSQWFTLATTLDNVYSATKLQTSRTLWGRSFNGTGNVSGDMTGVGNITGATFVISGSVGQMFLYNNTSKNDKRLTLYSQSNYAAIYNITADGSNVSDLVLGNNVNALYYDASADRWGIGTASPAYKLDVAGTLRATGRITAAGLTSSASIVANAGLSTTTLSASGAATLSSTLSVSGLIKALDGVQIGSTNDIGWYNHNSRIAAGINTARGVNAGSLLVSSAWSDYSKVPENGIYSKGEIVCSSDIYPDVTASVKLGSATKRWLGVYAQNGSFSGSVSVSSLNVVTEATVKTLVPDKLHLPSSLGNEVFDIYVDTEVNIGGEVPVSVSFEPLWYGLVSSSGSASKMGGSATVSVTRTDTGYYAVSGVPTAACVIAVPALITAGAAVTQHRYSATVTRVGDGCTVNMFSASDTRANYGFYLMIL